MSTTELFVTSVVCSFAIGVIATALAHEWSYRRMHRAVVRYRTDAICVRAELDMMRRHKGTPYVREAPGLRVVNGEPMYSADWLND